MADEKHDKELGTDAPAKPEVAADALIPDASASTEAAFLPDESQSAAVFAAAEEAAVAQAKVDDDAPADATAQVEGAASEAEEGLTQDALARRVAALGETDATEALARQEEEKLAERRRLAKKGQKGRGRSALETAASKKLDKIGTRAVPRARAVPVVAEADPLVDRGIAIRKWASENARAVQIITAVAVVAIAAGLGWTAYQTKRDESASQALAAAINDEHGRIDDSDKPKDDDAPRDPRPVFKTVDAMRDSALAKYRDVEAKYPGTGAAILSRLGEASILLDKMDAPGAAAAFEDVKNSPLAKADAEVRGRALEGWGMAFELLAAAKPDDAKTNLDKALNAYKELENSVDVLGFHELGMYDQARVMQAQGDKDKAIEQLKALHERLAKPGEAAAFPYLQEVADDRLRELDPKSAPPRTPANGMSGMGGMGGLQGLGGAGGAGGMDQEKIRKMIEQMQREQAGKK